MSDKSMGFELDIENGLCPVDKYQSHIDLFFHVSEECDWVFLGDSITNAGRWSELFPHIKVSNQGIDGDTSKGMLARSELVIDANPKVVFIMAGINDIIQGRSIDQIMHSYSQLIDILRSYRCKVIIQSTLFTSNSIWNSEVRLLNEVLKNLADERSVFFFDLNLALGFENRILDEATFDGVHLQAAMYIKWAQQIERML